MLSLFDTATGSVQPLEPAGDPVRLYVCGITPYDSAHLGHAFTYHVFDVLTRRLQVAGHAVHSVRNVTDCDDDIFRVARERGVDSRTLVADQVARFDAELASIDILPVDSTPFASAHVPAMIDWIRQLEERGLAYARDGWVYIDVSRVDGFGALSGLDRAAMTVLARERGGNPDDPRRDDPLDMVLWQPSLPDELVWPSPWGEGRPGWHIECSVLSALEAPDGVDVHGGGTDLVYPHHEAEIAQHDPVAGHPLARHWVHVAMVGLDGVKMSKSLGNLVFVHDLLRTAPPAAVRLMLAGHHHRTDWSYVSDDLAAAVERLRRYRAACASDGALDPGAAAAVEHAFLARIDRDLDTPGALEVLDRAVADARPGRGGGVAVGALLPRLLHVLGAGTAISAGSATGA